jgi:uncharacterized membrane protein
MSDETSPEPPEDNAPPEPQNGSWSEADRRMLMITIAGGLAANVGTVLIVGLAIVVLHYVRSGPQAPGGPWAVIGVAFVLSGLGGAWLNASSQNPHRQRWVAGLVWTLPVVIVAFLVLVGLAAGVK